jgi:uncharacterized phage protein gp47/JayE
MTQLTEYGFERDDLYTILNNMTTAVLAIYPDASLDPATQDGQLLGVFSNAIDELGQVLQAVYDSLSPSTASGISLSRIAEFNGIRLIPGTQSATNVVFTGNPGAFVPANFQIRNRLNNSVFATTAPLTLDSNGTGTVGVLATSVGATVAPSDSLTVMVSPLFGVRTVTNPSDATIGRNRESDAELRGRRTFSVATPSQSILEGIKGAVANIPQVIQVQAYENKTDVTDANGLPPHSFSIVAEGGNDQAIGETIFIREPVGANQYGNTTVTVIDSYNMPHSVTFMRPPHIHIFIRVELIPMTGWSVELIPLMKQNIVSWAQANLLIGVPVLRSQLYIPVNATGTTFAVAHILMGFSASDVAERVMLPIAFNEIAWFDTANIEVVMV